SQEPKLTTVVNIGLRVDKPVWDNTKRVNHQKISKYPHLRKTFVPSRVLTRTGLITPVKQNEKRAVHKVSTARPVSTVRPFAPKIAQTSDAIRPIYPRMDNVRPRGSYSPIKRAVVNTGKGKIDTDLKKSRWVWKPKGNYLDHVSKDSGSFMLKKVEYVDPKGISKSDHAVVNSGCSSHMTGNKAYLSDYEDYNGGFVAFENHATPKKVKKITQVQLSMDEELARKMEEEEGIRFNAEQEARALQEEEEERLNLEAARELQRQLDQIQEVPTQPTQS
ncbi:hypothetical protein Tco_0876954, partial [Tanacetum coccineum]